MFFHPNLRCICSISAWVLTRLTVAGGGCVQCHVCLERKNEQQLHSLLERNRGLWQCDASAVYLRGNRPSRQQPGWKLRNKKCDEYHWQHHNMRGRGRRWARRSSKLSTQSLTWWMRKCELPILLTGSLNTASVIFDTAQLNATEVVCLGVFK